MKPPDTQTIPLCRICHGREHAGHGLEKEFKLVVMVKSLSEYLERLEP